MNRYQALVDILRDSESDLMATILQYAHVNGYTKYTSTLVESWRLSISGLTNAISLYVSEYPDDFPEFHVDANYRDDPIASFGVIEARRHRSRGVDYGMFLGLFKYYRETYIDIVKKNVLDVDQAEIFVKYIVRCFDRIELSFSIEWATAAEDNKLNELQTTNVRLTNEKNKYLTLFESIGHPVVLVDDSNLIDNINMAGIRFLEHSEGSGFLYYNDECSCKFLDDNAKMVFEYKNRNVVSIFPWLESSLKAVDEYGASYCHFVVNVASVASLETIIFAVSIFPMCDVSNKFEGKIIVFEDITEKHAVEKQLHESEEKFRVLVETMNEGIVSLDEHRSVAYVNEKLCLLLGFSRNEIIGMDFENFIFPESRQEFLRQQLVRKDGATDPYELVLLNKAGEKVFVVSSPTPLLDHEQRARGSLEVMTDISTLKLIEMQLTHSQKMEAIGTMAAGIAHEMNTPLQYVIGNNVFITDSVSQLIRFANDVRRLAAEASGSESPGLAPRLTDAMAGCDIDFFSSEIPAALRDSLEGLNRISAIVSSVTQFARPDSDTQTLIDVNAEISNIINITHNEWTTCADLKTDFDHDLPRLACFASDVNQILLHLVMNAIHAIQQKYMNSEDKGEILVSTSSEARSILITVADDGVGIPERVRDKIFNPFFTTKDVGKGTGMGLAIVVKLMDKHDGKIWFDSVEGEGSTFYLRFPC